MIRKYRAICDFVYGRVQGMLALFAALVLIGCTTVPLTSMPRLARIDWEVTDISKAMIVLRYDEALRFDPSKIRFTFLIEEASVNSANVAGKPGRWEFITYLEANRPDQEAHKLMARQEKGGMKLASLAFASDAVGKIHEFRETIKALQKADREGSAGIAISLGGACLDNSRVEGDARGDVWIRTEETRGFVLAMRNVDLTGQAHSELSDEEREQIICKPGEGQDQLAS